MKCSGCIYMKITRYAEINARNRGIPRGHCMCTHPKAKEQFNKLCPKSPRIPGFIGYTNMGESSPSIKTSPRWCPLRIEKEKQE